MEALERREWPRTEAEIHLLRSAMFAAQVIIRDMERDGREEEIEQISRNISEVVPELPGKSATNPRESNRFGETALRELTSPALVFQQGRHYNRLREL